MYSTDPVANVTGSGYKVDGFEAMAKRRENYAVFRLDDYRNQNDAGVCYMSFLSAETRALLLSCMRYSQFITRWYIDDGDAPIDLTDAEIDEINGIWEVAYKEVIMGCDTQELIDNTERMAEALEALGAVSQGGCGCGGGGAGSTSPPASEVEPGYPDIQTGDPPDGFDTWGDYNDYKCSVATWLVGLVDADVGWWTVTGIAAMTATALLGSLLTPIPFDDVILLIGFIAALTLEGVLAAAIIDMQDAISNHTDALVCALYWSEDSEEAMANWETAIDVAVDAESSASYVSLEKMVLNGMMSTFLTNMMFERDEGLAATLPAGDCVACDECPVADVQYGDVEILSELGNHVVNGEWDGGTSQYWVVIAFGTTLGPVTYCGPKVDLEINSYGGSPTIGGATCCLRIDYAVARSRGGCSSWDVSSVTYDTGIWEDVRAVTINSTAAFSVDFDLVAV